MSLTPEQLKEIIEDNKMMPEYAIDLSVVKDIISRVCDAFVEGHHDEVMHTQAISDGFKEVLK